MKLLKRNVQISTLPARIVGFTKAIINIFFTFQQPLMVMFHYIRSTSPAQGYVKLRNGYHISFSGHKHDLISTIVVFCKRDYGTVAPGSICFDIGANIGGFALYAVSQGAKKVYAFEANLTTYQCLVRNIDHNGLNGCIEPYNLAVSGRSGDQVAFPTAPSPYNKMRKENTRETINVETISLDDILKLTPERHVDIIQMDIEGAEYAVFAGIQEKTLEGIDAIRMEYHKGPLPALWDRLSHAGFIVEKHKAEQDACGIIWFQKGSK